MSTRREFAALDDPRHKRDGDNGGAPEFSDEALALAFTAEHGDELRYVAAWNRWCRWDGTRWAHEPTLLAFDLARAICRDAAERASKETISTGVTSSKTVASVVPLARVDRQHASTVDQWDADPWVINTPGGILDLVTGGLQQHRREAYCTKITGAAPGGHCPRWLAFLDRIFAGDAELRATTPKLNGSFLAEGQPIPVKRFGLSAATPLRTYKLGANLRANCVSVANRPSRFC